MLVMSIPAIMGLMVLIREHVLGAPVLKMAAAVVLLVIQLVVTHIGGVIVLIVVEMLRDAHKLNQTVAVQLLIPLNKQ